MQIKPETIVAGFGIFLALWYLAASIYNRQRGIAVYRWLQGGLEDLGGKISGRWIGSSGSGADLRITDPNPPFRELQMIYLLASRELLPLFIADLIRGKRDRVIVKATLRSNPDAELEIVPARDELARSMRAEKTRPWALSDGPGGLVIGGRGRFERVRDATMPLLDQYAGQVNRISWSKKPPHLILTLTLDGVFQKGGSAASLYADITAAAEAISKG